MNIGPREPVQSRARWGTRHFLIACAATGVIVCLPLPVVSQRARVPARLTATPIPQIQYPVRLVGPLADWRAQDYSNSQGVSRVRFDAAEKCLIVDLNLITSDKHASSGEILLDLKYVPTLEQQVPIDMTGRQIVVDVELPASFVVGHRPNGVQVFVKDDQFRSQYGTWHNCTSPELVRIGLQPSIVSPIGGFTAEGFDPSAVRTLGVKFGTNDQRFSAVRISGQARIRRIAVTPDLPRSQPVPLPVTPPMPRLRTGSRWEFRRDGFYVNDQKTFLVGGNFRGIEYGLNFGTTSWFPGGVGFSRHPGFLAARFHDFRRAGVSLLRVKLLDDGRTLLDRDSRVVGMNEIFRQDVQTLLDLAARMDLKIQFVLVDYLIAARGQEIDGVWVQGRPDVIENPQRRAGFLADFLDPFLDEFGSHKAVLAFDVINEPEWLVAEAEDGGWETVANPEYKATQPVCGKAMREFITACVQRIRAKTTGKPVTVGVSCKYLRLIAGLDLDYLAPHYYPWMGDLDENLAAIPNGRPWMLEEFPGKGDLLTFLHAARKNGAAGAMFWNLNPEIDDQTHTFEEDAAKLLEIRSFVRQLP